MSTTDNRTVTIKRTFHAPLEIVWQAWTEAAHIVKWWGPVDMNTRVIEHDFRIGGKWQYAMTMPDGDEFITDGEYTDIVPMKRIVSSANFKPMTEGVEIQALFEASGDTTHFTFNIVHPTEAYKIAQEKMGILNGWGSVFDRLEKVLAK
jgi:uncharacterized protein YndB with AHSA1/START domain